jgi:hypothetical protein
MLATFLFSGSRDLVNQFPGIPVDSASGHRLIQFESSAMAVVNRARNDLFVTGGVNFRGAVNLYFGDPVALKKKDLPQRMFLPVMLHVMVPYTDEHRVGEAQGERLAQAVENAFLGIGGRLQMYDFYDSPIALLPGRFVSWAREYRGTWKELGNPTKEAYTNRQWTFQVRYVR